MLLHLKLVGLFAILAVFTGCSQGVSFSQGSNRSASLASSGTDPLCERSGPPLFWIGDGTTTTQCPTACPDGSYLKCNAVLQRQVQCIDGLVSQTGVTQVGTILDPIGSCPVQSTDCGSHASGSTWFQDTTATHTKTCELCPDGTKHTCVVTVQAQYACTNGVASATGGTKDGSVASYTNECLPVSTGSGGSTASTPVDETIQVPTTQGKADVLFIVDGTSSMYVTIQSLANRFNSLFSSWENVDWQIGITNANPVQGFFDSHAMGGQLEVLNPGFENYSNLTVLNKTVSNVDWIFQRNMSFQGLGWPGGAFTDAQPYAQSSPPEPLKTIEYAVNARGAAPNKNFFRQGAYFIPVIISDSDEKETGPQNSLATKPADVVSFFKTQMGSYSAGMKAFSIIVKPNDQTCLSQHNGIFNAFGGARYGVYLDQFATLTGGQSISICSSDFSAPLASISQSIRQAATSVALKYTPVANSVSITFTPSYSGRWSISGQTIVFDQPLAPNQVLAVHYSK